MIFYLSPSKQLFYLFSILYGSMLGAVCFNNLFIIVKLFFILILLHDWHRTINIYALRNIQKSIIRICVQKDILYIEDKTGACFYGKLNKFCYISKFLIILQINVLKSNKYKTVLITPDCLPPLQFRRLSMWIRY
jgi:hypothetical protein